MSATWEYYTTGPDPDQSGPSLFALLEDFDWQLICCDLLSEYGVDVADGILERRPWSWLLTLISGLFACESRIRAKHYPPETPKAPSPRR